MSVGVDFDFPRWLAARRGSQEQQAREGAAYAYAGERTFRRTLVMAKPVTIALEATTRMWRDHARTELLGSAIKIAEGEDKLARVWKAARVAAERIRVRVPPIFATPNPDIRIKVLGTEDAPHLLVNMAVADKLTDGELVAAIAHELGHVQNGHILFATALHYLTHSAAFFVRWAIQPAILTLQAWSRRAEITCDRAALIATGDLAVTLRSIVKLDGPAGDPDAVLAKLTDETGFARYAELFSSHPHVGKRVQALRLFADSALFAQLKGVDPAGKPSTAAVDKLVSNLLSVF